MNIKEKRISELRVEIDRIKTALDETNRSIIAMVCKLEAKVERIMDKNQIIPINNNRSYSKRESQLKDILETVSVQAHDLVQPLTVLIGRCELMDIFCKKHPEIKKNIDSMLLSAKKVEEIIHKIQSLNKQMLELYAEANNM